MSLEDVRQALGQSIEAMRSPIILGMGNEINADDGVGPLIIGRLAGKLRFFKTIDAGTMPENFGSRIAEMKPSHLIVLDAAMIEGPPGTIGLVDPAKVDDVIFTTHHIPLGRTIKRLLGMCQCEVVIIGIKPGTMETGGEMTPEVLEAADALVQLFLEYDQAA